MAVDVVADRITLPHPDLSAARPAIKIPAKVRDRLPAQSIAGSPTAPALHVRDDART